MYPWTGFKFCEKLHPNVCLNLKIKYLEGQKHRGWQQPPLGEQEDIYYWHLRSFACLHFLLFLLLWQAHIVFMIRQNNKSNLVMMKEQTRFSLSKNSQSRRELIKTPEILKNSFASHMLSPDNTVRACPALSWVSQELKDHICIYFVTIFCLAPKRNCCGS